MNNSFWYPFVCLCVLSFVVLFIGKWINADSWALRRTHTETSVASTLFLTQVFSLQRQDGITSSSRSEQMNKHYWYNDDWCKKRIALAAKTPTTTCDSRDIVIKYTFIKKTPCKLHLRVCEKSGILIVLETMLRIISRLTIIDLLSFSSVCFGFILLQLLPNLNYFKWKKW